LINFFLTQPSPAGSVLTRAAVGHVHYAMNRADRRGGEGGQAQVQALERIERQMTILDDALDRAVVQMAAWEIFSHDGPE
jgi:hypothetical protein